MVAIQPRPKPGPDYRLIFRRTIRLKGGRVIRAESYGLKAFAFWVKN
jgi:hypothetical protein